MKLVTKQVAQRLKESRKDAGLTQREVAQHLGMVVSQYQKFEAGIFELNYERIVLLCKLLEISSDYLLGLSDI